MINMIGNHGINMFTIPGNNMCTGVVDALKLLCNELGLSDQRSFVFFPLCAARVPHVWGDGGLNMFVSVVLIIHFLIAQWIIFLQRKPLCMFLTPRNRALEAQGLPFLKSGALKRLFGRPGVRLGGAPGLLLIVRNMFIYFYIVTRIAIRITILVNTL